MVRPSILPLVLLIALAAPAAGLARTSQADPHAPGDPWEGFNRRNFNFNRGLDRLAIRPLAKLTSGLTPGPIGKGIHNFLVNLNEPKVIINDLLQARPLPAARSLFSLAVNTTICVLGALDIAKSLGVAMHVNGFGDTLGRWGVGPGPYVVLPVLGPSTVRDLVGGVADDATLPIQFVKYPYRELVTVVVPIVGGLNEREMVAKEYETLLSGAADPYATLRSTYLQAREAEIRGQKALPALPDIEEEPAPATPANPAPEAPATLTPSAPPPDSAPAGEPPPTVQPAPPAPSPPMTPTPETPTPRMDGLF